MITRDTLVVVPAYNESAAVGDVVRALLDAGLDCVVVDDGSKDNTAEVARSAGAHVVVLPLNLGVGGALRCGFRYAVDRGYTRVVQCDADGQHPPSEIVRLLEVQAQESAHLVIGSRFLDGSSDYEIGRARRLMMRVLSGIIKRSSGLRLNDTTSGFRCIAEPLLSEFSVSYPVHYLGDTFEAALVAA
ncbi:MAG: glycosyltransferase family 2 protein, partial [Actinomycetes bacterium]